MILNDYVVEFEKILSNNWFDSNEPANAMIELENKGFKFEQKHFDKFINCITAGKSGSYLIGYNISTEREKILIYPF